MIRTHNVYSVQCDRCGTDCQEDAGEHIGWTDVSIASDEAHEADWLCWSEDLHFCTKCWKWDKNEDQVPKFGYFIKVKLKQYYEYRRKRIRSMHDRG